MIHYIIDGNNLMGKIKKLRKLQPQVARESLAFSLDNYFGEKRHIRVSLHFDGFPNTGIRTNYMKIVYSEKRQADDLIKDEIEMAKNRSVITLVSSDHNLIDFAKVCRCSVKMCEDFQQEIFSRPAKDEEEEKIKSMSTAEFKRLFGLE